MSKTTYKDYPGIRCDDCGVENVIVKIIEHSLVPINQSGHFCDACFTVRRIRADQQLEPLPIGETRYFGRCKNRSVSIRYPASAIGPGDHSISNAIMDIRTRLGIIEMNTTITDGLVEFYFRWVEPGSFTSEKELDKDSVESALNELRARFPIVTISVKYWL